MVGEYFSRRMLWQNKLAEEVLRGLLSRIRDGALAPGAPLPSREALAGEYVTTTTVIDRALERLAEMRVAAPDPDGSWHVTGFPGREEGFALPTGPEATRADIIAVLELRVPVECEAAALAAARRSEAQLQAIRDAAEAFAGTAPEGAPAQADFRFHVAIAEAAGNPYFRDLVEYIGPLLIPRMRVQLTPDAAGRDENLARSRTEHAAIVDAIAAGDAAAARTAMSAHLARTLDMMRALPARADTEGEIP